MTTTPEDIARALAQAALSLHAAAEKLDDTAKTIAGLEVRPARRQLKPAPSKRALETLIEAVLRGPRAPMSVQDLAAEVQEPAAVVQRAIARLSKAPCPTRSKEQAPDARQIHNHGTDDAPLWRWVIGDHTDAPTLYAEIELILRRRPYTFAELTAATGARRGRISGATVEFARSNLPIYTIGGSGRKYRWYIGPTINLPPDERKEARRVRLAPDKNKV